MTHYSLLASETLDWFRVGTRMMSLVNTWVITSIDPEGDKFRALQEGEWGEEHTFWVYELFWFQPILTRFQRESVS